MARVRKEQRRAIDTVSQFNILFNIATTNILEVVWVGFICLSPIYSSWRGEENFVL